MNTINVYVNQSFKHFIDKELNQNKTNFDKNVDY